MKLSCPAGDSVARIVQMCWQKGLDSGLFCIFSFRMEFRIANYLHTDDQREMKMNLQYISDSSGQTTGVFIPISEWNALKEKLEGIDLEAIDIPAWQIEAVRKRLAAYRQNPREVLDFDTAIDEIEKSL